MCEIQLKNIKEIIIEFLIEQEKRLKANIFSKYEDVMELFENYLNYYAYQYLDKEEDDLYEQEYDEGKRE